MVHIRLLPNMDCIDDIEAEFGIIPCNRLKLCPRSISSPSNPSTGTWIYISCNTVLCVCVRVCVRV